MRFFFFVLSATILFVACQQSAPTSPAAPDAASILKHKYWVSKPYHDALFSENLPDTLAYMNCAELIFQTKDTVIMTACMSDAGVGVYTITGSNSISIKFEGLEDKPITATLDEKTGTLQFSFTGEPLPYWPTAFVAKDEVDVNNFDILTLSLGRLRLAGNYQYQTKTGEMAVTSLTELHADGTAVNFGGFDKFEPWIAGVGSSCIQHPPMNLMNLMHAGHEGHDGESVAVGWQLHGDTLRIWDTQNLAPAEDLPEYKLKGEPRVYVKVK
ncbi:MAG: hypothetical protein IT261_01235 [Saprospiraceae bacterium]|nr:hypothetical protein [Saprospiraceae bacterium]